ncbi:hypothetical protein ACLOJK_023629 [Asimina triloba]
MSVKRLDASETGNSSRATLQNSFQERMPPKPAKPKAIVQPQKMVSGTEEDGKRLRAI